MNKLRTNTKCERLTKNNCALHPRVLFRVHIMRSNSDYFMLCGVLLYELVMLYPKCVM